MQEISFEESTTAQRYHVGDIVPVGIGDSISGNFEVVRVDACYAIPSQVTAEALKRFRYELRRRG